MTTPNNPRDTNTQILSEEVEKLFNLRIDNSGNWIGIKLDSRKQRVWVRYEAFLKLRQSIEALVAQQAEAVTKEAEIALARKVLAVSGGHHKIKGFTQAKRLKLLTDKMNEIIPDVFGIIEDETYV